MSLNATEQQPETTRLAAQRREYSQRFNLLDMLGLSDDLSPVPPRPDTFGPPEEDNYSQQVVHLAGISKG
jgi:hypothetical protein